MKRLIKLEITKNKFQTYIVTVCIITAVMLGLLCLLAHVSRLDSADKDMFIFSNYTTLLPLFSVLNMTVFSVLASVMYTKFVLEDYSPKQVILLFSYPIKRGRILLAKVSLISSYIFFTMIISSFLIFSLFAIIENSFHLLTGEVTASFVADIAVITVLQALNASSIGLIACSIAFPKKSIPTAIISAVLLSSIFCNVVFNLSANGTIIIFLSFFMLIISAFFLIFLVQKVNTMEVV